MKGYLSLFAFLFVFLTSCYESVEGCTDPLAANYRLNADESCSSCCTYPELLIKIDHKWGNTVFQNGKEYTSSKMQNFTVINHKFYLSNINIFDDKGSEISNSKTSLFTSGGEDVVVPQNYCLINGTLSDCKTGNFKHLGKVSKLTFNHLLPSSTNRLDSLSVSRDPALSWSEGMYRNGIYQGFFFTISIPGRITPFSIFLLPVEDISLALSNFKHEKPGKPIEINVVLDYEKLFKDADFTNEITLKQSLEKNVKNSFIIP